MEFLDQFRGFAVSLMIVVNILAGFTVTPAWLQHATRPGAATVPDFVIPSFLFVGGAALDLALARSRAARGTGPTVRRFVLRGFALVGFGILGSLLLGQPVIRTWGVLETLGLSGLVALPFVLTGWRGRTAAALLLAGSYELVSRLGWRAWLVAHDTGHLGGPPAALAWAGVMLAGSLAGALVRQDNRPALHRYCALLGVTGVAAGLALNKWLPMSKPLVTPSYLLLVTGAAALLLLAFSRARPQTLLLRVPGTNALTIFLLHGIVLVTVMKRVPADCSWPVTLAVLAGVYGFCWFAGWALYRRGIFIRL